MLALTGAYQTKTSATSVISTESRFMLCRSNLNATRETSPSSRGVNSMGDSLSLGSKTNYLLKDGFPFFVDCTACLKHYRSKIVVRFLECSSITIELLVLCIGLAWLDGVEMGNSERMDDGDINGEATP